ncbi:GNAT family N-acetyltransferase [Roseovarius sp. SCSIO 43702]|uniref:GNAT family N-acetyltransferase n=1 Tax=Roseovarius sp. SCSIO 43702 TaxID=2823043 RepID=UPI001C72BDC6|nr:GNAT family N-acetyltransferase [Roseovarius sp. SCSIO 43702]QYX56554.1 GNAT family N-acetyltransferase [Roseovarius sp. SCSIO 43702]
MLHMPADPLPDEALVIDTPRLRLRPYAQTDLALATATLTDPRVTRYVCDPKTPAEVAALMPLITRRGAGGRLGMWAVERRDTGATIGDGILTPLPIDAPDTDWASLDPGRYPDAEIEVGYMLLPEAWGQGFATEICTALLRFAFTRTALAEIVAITDPDNAASQRVLVKSGMIPEGARRAYGETCPAFRLTRDQWHDGATQPEP